MLFFVASPWSTRGMLVLEAVDRRRPRVVYPRAYAIALSFPRIARGFMARFSPPIKRPPP